jgi:hypothetical protein
MARVDAASGRTADAVRQLRENLAQAQRARDRWLSASGRARSGK